MLTFGRLYGKLMGQRSSAAAIAGQVGQYLKHERALGDALSIATVTNVDVCTVTLTPGVWLAEASIWFQPNSVSSFTNKQAGISSVAGSMDTGVNGGGYLLSLDNFGAQCSFYVGRREFSVDVNTPIYLTARSNFSGGTMTVAGFLGALRIR